MHLPYLLVVVILCNVFSTSPRWDGTERSQEERKPMEIHVGWDVADLTSVNGNLVSQHTRSRDLDRVSPIVVAVAETIGKVEDCVFGDVRGVGRNVEVGRLDGSLSNGMRHQEEVKGSIDDLRLLNESAINVGSLRWVGNSGVHTLMEESLSDSFVDDDQGVFWKARVSGLELVLLLDNLVELLQLVGDDLGSHRVSDTVSVDDDVLWEGTVVLVSECLESTLEVLLEHARADDLLALLALGTRLGVVLAHVLVVGSAETDD